MTCRFPSTVPLQTCGSARSLSRLHGCRVNRRKRHAPGSQWRARGVRAPAAVRPAPPRVATSMGGPHGRYGERVQLFFQVGATPEDCLSTWREGYAGPRSALSGNPLIPREMPDVPRGKSGARQLDHGKHEPGAALKADARLTGRFDARFEFNSLRPRPGKSVMIPPPGTRSDPGHRRRIRWRMGDSLPGPGVRCGSWTREG